MRCPLRSSSWREQVVEELAGGARVRDARGLRDGGLRNRAGEGRRGGTRVGGRCGQLVGRREPDAELVLEALAQLLDVLVAVLDRLAQALDGTLAQLLRGELPSEFVDLVADLVGRGAALRRLALGPRRPALGLALAGLLLLGRGEELATRGGRIRCRDAGLVGAE